MFDEPLLTLHVALGVLIIVIPATGIVLVLSGDDDVLWLHVAGHMVFFAVLAGHVAMAVTKRLLPRML